MRYRSTGSLENSSEILGGGFVAFPTAAGRQPGRMSPRRQIVAEPYRSMDILHLPFARRTAPRGYPRRQSSTSSRVPVPTPVGAGPAGPGPGSRRTRIPARASRASGCQPGALGPRWVEADAWNPLAVVRSFAPEWIEGSPFQRTWPPRRTEAIAGAAGPHFCCARYCDCAAWDVRRFSRRVQGEKGVPIMRPGRHCHA